MRGSTNFGVSNGGCNDCSCVAIFQTDQSQACHFWSIGEPSIRTDDEFPLYREISIFYLPGWFHRLYCKRFSHSCPIASECIAKLPTFDGCLKIIAMCLDSS